MKDESRGANWGGNNSVKQEGGAAQNWGNAGGQDDGQSNNDRG